MVTLRIEITVGMTPLLTRLLLMFLICEAFATGSAPTLPQIQTIDQLRVIAALPELKTAY